MRSGKYLLLLLFLVCALTLVTTKVFAHEAYVLTPEQFHAGLQVYNSNPFAALVNAENIEAFLKLSGLVVLIYFLNFFWAATKASSSLDHQIKQFASLGPLTIRLIVGISFFASAYTNSFLGPELPLNILPYSLIIRAGLFLLSILILLGLFTEICGFVGLLIFFLSFFKFGFYMFTYLNYLGELIILSLFGSRFLSLDYYFFGKTTFLKHLEKYSYLEVPIMRVMYALALIYAGYSIKFIHQGLTILVYNQYNLKQFFHAGAQFIAAGAGLAEVSIGLFILLGFAQRLTIIISLVFITLSLIYFKEMVWPHLMLYGISISLIINSADRFTLDKYLVPWIKRLRRV